MSQEYIQPPPAPQALDADDPEPEPEPEPMSLDDGGSEEKEEVVTLVPLSGQPVTISKKFALMSGLVETTLSTGDPNSDETPELPLQLSESTLGHVVRFMQHHDGKDIDKIPKPLKSKVISELVTDQWDAEFIDGFTNDKRQDLYDLAKAANYMNIDGLLHLCCAKLASLIKGQELAQVRGILDPLSEQNKAVVN